MPDPATASKSRLRLGLWAPYVAVLVLAIAGGAGWFALKMRLEQGLDEATLRLRAQGYAVSWRARRVDGFPFRLDLTLEQPRIAEPSGWALAAPALKGEAYAYEADHWIFVAPLGLVVTRPGKGALEVTGQAMRASLAGLPAAPRFSFEGVKLAFKPQPGAAPGSLSSAERLELHLQPGPDDQAALLVRLGVGHTDLPPALSRLANGQPVSGLWDSRLSHFSRLAGPDWPSAVRRWTAAGGAMSLMSADLTAGQTAISVGAATLTVGSDGRLRGAMPLTLRQGPPAP